MWSTIEVFTEQFYLDQFYSQKKRNNNSRIHLVGS